VCGLVRMHVAPCNVSHSTHAPTTSTTTSKHRHPPPSTPPHTHTHTRAGLAQYYPDPSSLEGVLVCVAANLKTAKLAGEPSQAMVLAAEATGPEGQTIVKALQPPGNGA